MASSKDVAKKAGVSQTTVSRVLNRPESVREATRDKVRRAIEELGYLPDPNARGLASQKTHTIALISGPLHNPFYVDAAEEIVNYANRAGYRVNVHFSDGLSHSVYESVLANRVDGLVLSCILLDDPIVRRLERMKLPFVGFNRRHASMGSFVEIDNFAAGSLAFEHLFGYGHRDILWVGGHDKASTFERRLAGFKAAWQSARQKDGTALSVRVVNYKQTDKPELYSLLTTLQAGSRLPTAVCAATDAIALEVINTLIGMGFSVPADISVIGIDNVAVSATPLVRLTTVGTADGSRLGLTAIRSLIGMLENPQSSGGDIRITFPVALFVRNTTRRLQD